jgi:hypothetical protein
MAQELAWAAGQASLGKLPNRHDSFDRLEEAAASVIVVSTPPLERESPEMTARIMRLAATALDERRKSLSGSRVLLVGIVTVEMRDLLQEQGAIVTYHNPLGCHAESELLASSVQRRRRSDYSEERRQNLDDGSEHGVVIERRHDGPQHHMRRGTDGLQSISLTEEELARTDLVIILTGNPGIDRGLIARKADIVIDARHALGDDLRWSAMEVVVRS